MPGKLGLRHSGARPQHRRKAKPCGGNKPPTHAELGGANPKILPSAHLRPYACFLLVQVAGGFVYYNFFQRDGAQPWSLVRRSGRGRGPARPKPRLRGFVELNGQAADPVLKGWVVGLSACIKRTCNSINCVERVTTINSPP